MPSIASTSDAAFRGDVINHMTEILNRRMKELNMKPADLARAVFGEKTLKNGKKEPKGKDAVSRWCNGKNLPEPGIVGKLAEVLQVTVDELIPHRQSSNAPHTTTFEFKSVEGHPTKTFLTIARLIDMEDAVKIADIIAQGVKRNNK
jgi:transcriptional regulator with XRE-family HTH domain